MISDKFNKFNAENFPSLTAQLEDSEDEGKDHKHKEEVLNVSYKPFNRLICQ